MSLMFWRKNVENGQDMVVSKENPMPVQLIGDDPEEVLTLVDGKLPVIVDNMLMDDAPFVISADKVLPVGAVADQTSPDSVNEGDIGVLRMTLTRILLTALRGQVTAEGDTPIIATAGGLLRAQVVGADTGSDARANGAIGYALSAEDTATVLAQALYALAPDGAWDRLRSLADSGDGLGILKVGGAVDDAAFAASGVVMPIAGLADETSPDSVDEGDVGALRMTLTRLLKVALYGKASAEGDTSIAASASGYLGVYNVNSNTGADAIANTIGYARNSSEVSVLQSVGPLALAPDGSWDRLRSLADSGEGLGVLKVGTMGELITLAASAARTSGANGTAVTGLGWRNRYIILFDLTNADTDAGDTLDVYVDVSLDGTTWLNAVHFTQIVGTDAASKRFAVLDPSSPGTAEILVTSDAAAAAVRPSLFGPQMRARWAITDAGTANASFTFSVVTYAI